MQEKGFDYRLYEGFFKYKMILLLYVLYYIFENNKLY